MNMQQHWDFAIGLCESGINDSDPKKEHELIRLERQAFGSLTNKLHGSSPIGTTASKESVVVAYPTSVPQVHSSSEPLRRAQMAHNLAVTATEADKIIRECLKADPLILKDLYRCSLGSYSGSSTGACEWTYELRFFRGHESSPAKYTDVTYSGKIVIQAKFPARDAPDREWPEKPYKLTINSNSSFHSLLEDVLQQIFPLQANCL